MSTSKVRPFTSDSDEDEDDLDFALEDYKCDKDIERKWDQVEKLLAAIPLSKHPMENEMSELSLLVSKAATPAQKVRILVFLIDTYFRTKDDIYHPMPVPTWGLCAKSIREVILHLKENPNILMSYDHNVIVNSAIETKKGSDYKGVIRVWGDLKLFVLRLYGDYLLSLASIGHKSESYKARLQDEDSLLEITISTFIYYNDLKVHAKASKVALIGINLVYYRNEDCDIGLLSPRSFSLQDCCKWMVEFCNYVARYGESKDQARAEFFKLYHCAVTNNFLGVTNEVLVQNWIQMFEQKDDSTRVLCNRGLSQMGVYFFKGGLIEASHLCFLELFGRGKVKLLLAQERDDPIDGIGTSYHMQIDVEVLVSVFLLSALAIGVSTQRREISDEVNSSSDR
ncbi:Ulp1 peptidase [Ranunculus cassubicifolius]